MESSVAAGPAAELGPRPLSASALLAVWERGALQQSTERALTLLAASCPNASVDALRRLPVGERDAQILRAREQTLGGELAGVATCPTCGARLGVTIETAGLYAGTTNPGEAGPHVLQLERDGFQIRFRLPTSDDLRHVHPGQELGANRLAVLARCILSARRDDIQVSVNRLPEAIVGAIEQAMSDADPHANIEVPIACAECGHEWSAELDVLRFFWAEIEAWARRLQREVHLLASAYGWREGDILALSAVRRHAYLELIGT